MPLLRRASFCLTLLTSALGCAQSEVVDNAPKEEVRLYFPSETASVIAPEIARFNNLLLKTPQGASVSVVPFQSDGPSPSYRILSDLSERRSAVWLAPSSLAVDVLTQRSRAELGSSPECVSVATTDLGFAVRQSDLFSIDQYEGSGLLAQFLNTSTSGDSAKRPILAIPAPGSSASGLALFAMQVSGALGARPESLSNSLLQAPNDSLRTAQGRVSRYFRSEQEMLRWLRERPEGQPAVALSSRQQVLAANASPIGAQLKFIRSAAPQLGLDYSLCSVDSHRLSATTRDARLLVYQHFSRPETTAGLRTIGFTTSDDALSSARRFPDGLGSSLIQLWAKVRKPAAIAFVIDTSSEVSPDLLQRVSRELASFARWESVSGDSLSLISTSTRPEMLASLTTDPRQFQRALEDLRPSGAAVPLDGMSLAFSSLESVSQSNFRTAVVLVASKLDANSATSFGALRSHFAQSLARSGTALYVVGVESGTEGEKEPQSSDWLKTFAADLGAAYIQTSVADLPTSFRTVLQQVE